MVVQTAHFLYWPGAAAQEMISPAWLLQRLEIRLESTGLVSRSEPRYCLAAPAGIGVGMPATLHVPAH